MNLSAKWRKVRRGAAAPSLFSPLYYSRKTAVVNHYFSIFQSFFRGLYSRRERRPRRSAAPSGAECRGRRSSSRHYDFRRSRAENRAASLKTPRCIRHRRRFGVFPRRPAAPSGAEFCNYFRTFVERFVGARIARPLRFSFTPVGADAPLCPLRKTSVPGRERCPQRSAAPQARNAD